MDFVDLFPFAPEVGYLGLVLVNFVGSLVPFVPLPGFLLLATMSVGDAFDLHVLALLSAVAATAAKQIIFYISYGGRRMIGTGTRRRMRPFERLVRKYGAAAAFFAAATPVPDDLVYVPLGLARYDPKRFLVATFSGKIVLSYVIVFVSHYMGLSLVEPVLENIDDATPVYVGIIAFGAVMTASVILLLRLDWVRILGRLAPWTLEEEGEGRRTAAATAATAAVAAAAAAAARPSARHNSALKFHSLSVALLIPILPDAVILPPTPATSPIPSVMNTSDPSDVRSAPY